MGIFASLAEILHFNRRRTNQRKRKASVAERRQMLFRAFYMTDGDLGKTAFYVAAGVLRDGCAYVTAEKFWKLQLDR